MKDNKENNPLLYCWEIIAYVPDPKDNKKQLRCISIVAANYLEQVWEWLKSDRTDENTEIVSITRFGPIVEILDLNKDKTKKN